jgi:hypothetical protein
LFYRIPHEGFFLAETVLEAITASTPFLEKHLSKLLKSSKSRRGVLPNRLLEKKLVAIEKRKII